MQSQGARIDTTGDDAHLAALCKRNVLLPRIDIVLELEHHALVDGDDVAGVGGGIVSVEGARQADAVGLDVDQVGEVAFELGIAEEVEFLGSSAQEACLEGLSLCGDGAELLLCKDGVLIEQLELRDGALELVLHPLHGWCSGSPAGSTSAI